MPRAGLNTSPYRPVLDLNRTTDTKDEQKEDKPSDFSFLRPSLRDLLSALDAGQLDSEGKPVSEALESYKDKAEKGRYMWHCIEVQLTCQERLSQLQCAKETALSLSLAVLTCTR